MFCHWKSNKAHRGDSVVEARVSFEMSPVGATINKEHMANTYSQISIHAVFAVKGRDNIILSTWRDDLHKYISGIITGNGGKSLAVGGWKDYVHIFFGLPVTSSISEAVWIWCFFSFKKPKRPGHKIYYGAGRPS